MSLLISLGLLNQIHSHGEAAYPEEGAGLMLGMLKEEQKVITRIIEFANAREQGARHNRYLLTPQDYLLGEQQAAELGLEVLGIFHSHPDHPNQPSEYDREFAMPYFSYLITSVQAGQAIASRSWTLSEDHSKFNEETITMLNQAV